MAWWNPLSWNAAPATPSRRSLENPSTPLDPDFDDTGWGMLGLKARTGQRVTPQRALAASAWWRAVALISETMARMPLQVLKGAPPGMRPDPSHPAYALLFRRPNEAQTPFVFKAKLYHDARTRGNGYAYVVRDGAGRPLELLPLDPDRTEPAREGGRPLYLHQLKSNEWRRLRAEDVIHVMGPSLDGISGMDLVAVAKQALGLGLGMQDYASTFFRNSAKPSVVIQVPGKIKPEAAKNLRESWERIHAGIENAHRTAVLEEGATVKEMTINARDAQMLESRQFSLIEIANFTGVPPHKLGSAVNVSYKSLEQENQGFLEDCIDGWAVRGEEQFAAKLLSAKEQQEGTHAVQFDRSRLVIPDEATKADCATKLISVGVWCPDEGRAYRGMDPRPDGLGGVYYHPANLTPLPDGFPEKAEPADPAADPVPEPAPEPKPGDATP